MIKIYQPNHTFPSFFKETFIVIFLLCCFSFTHAQLFTQSSAQTAAAGAGGGVPMVGIPGANVIFSSAGKVNPPFGAGNTPCTNGYAGFTVPTGITSYSPSGPAIEITLSPASGYSLSASGVSARLRYSATGPANAVFAYSINGGTTWVNNSPISLPQVACQSGSVFSWNFPCNVIVGFSQTFKFRIYFYNATGPTGTTQIENLTVNGTAIVCTAPSASISGTTTICGGQNTNITFTGTPSSTVSYNINGGATQTVELGCSGSVVLNTGNLSSTTTYNLVSVGFGSCSQSLSGSAVVTVIPPVSSAVISGSAAICSGNSTNLSVNITGGVSPYTLVYFNGSTNTTINNYISGTPIPVSPTVNTNYTLVSVTSIAGCSSLSGSAIVTISPNPTAAVLSGAATICNGSSTNLSVAVTGGLSPYTIVYFNGASNVTVNNYISGSAIPVSPSSNTTYSLVSVSSAVGCAGSGLSGTALVTVRPTPTAIISGTTAVCQNSGSPNITFNNPQTIPVTVTYNINGGVAQTLNIGASASATVPAPTNVSGTFTYNLVSVLYQSEPTCTAAIIGQSATVTINSLYTSAVISGTSTICSGNSANLAVNITGGVSPYTVVYFNGSTNSTINNYVSGTAIPVSPIVNTTYSLISVSGTGGCGGSGMGGTAIVSVSSVGTWLGFNSNWNDPLNWCDGNIPTSATNVVIPAGLSLYPIITTVDPKSRNMTIASGASLTITASGVFSFAGNVNNSGTISNSGTIVLNGTTGLQTFPGTGVAAPMNNLVVNNSSGVNLNRSLNIAGTLTLTSGIFNIGGTLTLTINNPIAGTTNNLTAVNTASVTIAGTAAGVNLPASVTQLRNFTVSNTSGTTLQGNLNISTLCFIQTTAGIVDTDTYSLNGTGNLQMNGGNLYLGKNGVVLPELSGTYTLTGGTVTFAGLGISSDAQTIRPVNYFNLSSVFDGDRILSSTGTIGVSNIFFPFTNLYTVQNSTVNFNKTNVQNIPAFTFYNLTLSGGNFIKTLTGPINIRGVLNFVTTTKLSLANHDVTLKSDINNTATVAAIPSANSILYGTGRFIVERYIPTGNIHPKSWQLLAVPVGENQTIKEAWQEGAIGGPANNPVPGFGTQLTSDLPAALALGFDFYTPAGTTIKTYNSASNLWQSVSSTSLPVTNNKGYMLFVRGDRSVTAYNQAAVPTVLRTKGKLFSPGTDAPSSIPVAAGKLESVGNPYASAIDFTNVLSGSSGIDAKFYVWDPLLPGSNGYGAYQTFSSVNGYLPIPGGTANYPTGVAYSKIQPGQAFFTFSTPGGTVNFSENNKISGNQLVFRLSAPNPSLNHQALRSWLYTANGSLADGNVVIAGSIFNNDFEKDDALKISNFGENFGIRNNNVNLALDARKPLTITDTVFYQISNLRRQGYQLKFTAEQFNLSGVSPFLIDKFTASQTPVNNTDTTIYSFTVTADPLSSDTGRFFVIFKNTHRVYPVSIILTANFNKQKANLNWHVDRETGVDHYQIEKGNDSTNLSTIFNNNAVTNNGFGKEYFHVDESMVLNASYYRIKAVMIDGRIYYSNIVKVEQEYGGDVMLYPNPAINKTFKINFGNLKGRFNIQLLDMQGRFVYSKPADIQNNQIIPIFLDPTISAGLYHVKIMQSGKLIHTENIFVK